MCVLGAPTSRSHSLPSACSHRGLVVWGPITPQAGSLVSALHWSGCGTLPLSNGVCKNKKQTSKHTHTDNHSHSSKTSVRSRFYWKFGEREELHVPAIKRSLTGILGVPLLNRPCSLRKRSQQRFIHLGSSSLPSCLLHLSLFWLARNSSVSPIVFMQSSSALSPLPQKPVPSSVYRGRKPMYFGLSPSPGPDKLCKKKTIV